MLSCRREFSGSTLIVPLKIAPAAVARRGADRDLPREVGARLVTHQRREADAERALVDARQLEVPARRVLVERAVRDCSDTAPGKSCAQVWLPPACIDQRLLRRLFTDASTVL